MDVERKQARLQKTKSPAGKEFNLKDGVAAIPIQLQLH
jgi:hypothetical protein